jgi:hypothetical protein
MIPLLDSIKTIESFTCFKLVLRQLQSGQVDPTTILGDLIYFAIDFGKPMMAVDEVSVSLQGGFSRPLIFCNPSLYGRESFKLSLSVMIVF